MSESGMTTKQIRGAIALIDGFEDHDEVGAYTDTMKIRRVLAVLRETLSKGMGVKDEYKIIVHFHRSIEEDLEFAKNKEPTPTNLTNYFVEQLQQLYYDDGGANGSFTIQECILEPVE